VGWRSAADSGPFILIVPDTKSPYSDWAVWSGDPMDDFDEMNAEMGEVMDLVDDVAIHYNVDHDSVYAYGFSDGGLFLAIAGMMYAADYAGLVIAGYGWGAFYGSEPSWLIPVYMICGQSDSFYSYAEQSQGFLASQGHPLEWVPVPGVGHSFSGLMSYRSPSTIYGWLSSH
jgi:predicted esterase